MKIFYRISDKGYQKAKLPGANKWTCFHNFKEIFRNHEVKIIVDNCKEETIQQVGYMSFDTRNNFDFAITNLGNAGSLKHAINLSLEEDDEEIIYYVEDDYLHLHKSPRVIEEGLNIADYVTLYDHPDKYTSIYGGETSRVLKTKSSHWRFTLSTCMTFATKVKTIKNDYPIWAKYLTEDHPDDHGVFSELHNTRGSEKLAVSIPGLACHTDLTFSGRMGSVLMEEWAIDMMANHLRQNLEQTMPDMSINLLLANTKSKWESLVMMDAILAEVNKKHL
jgi:hypothetical protein